MPINLDVLLNLISSQTEQTTMLTTLNSPLSLTSFQIGYIWLILSIIFLFLEIGSPGLFFFIAFSIGCIFGSLSAFLEYSNQTQCLIFIIVSLLSFIILKKVFSSKNKIEDEVKTNIYGLLGQKAIVIETINPPKSGYVKVKGDSFVAKSERNEIIETGKMVSIIRIEGNCLIVRNL